RKDSDTHPRKRLGLPGPSGGCSQRQGVKHERVRRPARRRVKGLEHGGRHDHEIRLEGSAGDGQTILLAHWTQTSRPLVAPLLYTVAVTSQPWRASRKAVGTHSSPGLS